jgi:hypothetical protein
MKQTISAPILPANGPKTPAGAFKPTRATSPSPAEYACALEVHKRAPRLSVDDWVAIVAIICIVVAIVLGSPVCRQACT